MFEGLYVALPTCFRDGALDLDSFQAHVDRIVAAGVDGLVPCGTTGEAPTLTDAEREALVRICVERARGPTAVVAGAGTNDTATSIRMAKIAEEAGADGILVVVPYYNRPPQEGLYRHFEQIAEATSLPVMLYNVPSRTGADLEPATVVRLAGHERIVAIKEAKADPERFRRLLEIPGLTVLSGDDAAAWPLREMGGHGVVSVAANIVPEAMAAICRAPAERARAEHERLRPLFEALFVETNPIPLKAALALLGRMTHEVRLPLVPTSPATRARLAALLPTLVVPG